MIYDRFVMAQVYCSSRRTTGRDWSFEDPVPGSIESSLYGAFAAGGGDDCGLQVETCDKIVIYE
jgi:hypothetical protein